MITFHTKNTDAVAVLAKMKDFAAKKAETWGFSEADGFNHTAQQWDKVGRFDGGANDAAKKITFSYKKGKNFESKVGANAYDYLHGRFIEFLMVNFKDHMENIIITDNR